MCHASCHLAGLTYNCLLVQTSTVAVLQGSARKHAGTCRGGLKKASSYLSSHSARRDA